MLVIGSRALRRSFPDARLCLDWDLVATRAEVDALTGRLEPLYPRAWSAHKRLFLLGDRPVEVIIADDTVWTDVLALEGARTSFEGLGAVTVASPSTLLLLKLSHVHLTHHWRKTSGDVDFLLGHDVTLPEDLEPLLERLRVHAERRRGVERCAFGPPMRLFAHAASPAIAQRRRAMHRALGDRVSAWVDPARPELARSLPSTRRAAADLLAELATVHAVEHVLAPARGGERATDKEEANAIAEALETLCTDVLGRRARVALAPHAREAARRVRPRFSRALGAIAAKPTGIEGASAFAPSAARADLGAMAPYVNGWT
jgi:hypothetical protein